MVDAPRARHRHGGGAISPPARASSPGCSLPSGADAHRRRARRRHARRPSGRCCPTVAARRRATAEAIPLADRLRRRGHGGPGVPLVRRRPAVRRAATRPAPRRTRRHSSGTPATGPSPGSTRCGRSWTASRSRRRGATTRTGATSALGRRPGSDRSHRRRSATTRGSRTTGRSNASRSSATSLRSRPTSRTAVLDEVRTLLAHPSRDPGPPPAGDAVPGRRLLVRAGVSDARCAPASRSHSAATAGWLSRVTGRGQGATISGRVINAVGTGRAARAGTAGCGSGWCRRPTARPRRRACSQPRSRPGRPVATNATGANLTSGSRRSSRGPRSPASRCSRSTSGCCHGSSTRCGPRCSCSATSAATSSTATARCTRSATRGAR